MSRTEPELWAAYAAAQETSDSESEQAQLEEVVRHADAGGFHKLAFVARRALASAYCVGRQWDKAFPLFSRCLSEHDNRTWDLGPAEEAALRSWYCWIVQSMAEFPDINLPQIYAALDDVEQRHRSAGCSLREVYETRRSVAQIAADWAQEEHYFHQWMASGGPNPGSVWDFALQVDRLTQRGQDVKAYELAAPVLAGARTFDGPPVPVQCDMLLPLARLGRHAEAVQAFRRARRDMERGVYRYEYSALLIEFCALTGNLDAALAQFSRMMWGFPTLNRPTGKMDFAAVTALLMRQMINAGRGAEPVHWAKQDEDEAVTATQLHERMLGVALDLAARFDTRNGTTAQGDRVRARVAAEPVARIPVGGVAFRHRLPVPRDLPPHDLLSRAEWHFDRGRDRIVRDHLRALGQPPPQLAARRTYLLAQLNGGAGLEADLLLAAQQFQAAGDVARHLLCLCDVAELRYRSDRKDEALALLSQAVDALHQQPDQRAIALGERMRARLLAAGSDDAAADQALQRAAHHAAWSGDPFAVAKVAGLQVTWAVADKKPPAQVIQLAETTRSAALAAGWMDLVIRALDRLRVAHGQAGTLAAHLQQLDAELAQLPPDAPGWVRACLGYQQAMVIMDANTSPILGSEEAARAAPALEHLVAEESIGAVPAVHWYHLARAYFGAGRIDDAVDAADDIADWLDRLRERGSLDDPSIAISNRMLLALGYQQLGYRELASEQFETLARHARELDAPGLLAWVRDTSGGPSEG